MQCKNNTFIDRLFTFKWIIKNNYHKYTLWNSTIPNTNHSSGTSTSSHSPGTPSMVSNVRHSLPKRMRRHGDGIWQKSSRNIWRQSDEYTWVQGDRTPDKGRKAVAHKMGREEKPVYGEAMVSRQDVATENQLYSERAEHGLRRGILQISDAGSMLWTKRQWWLHGSATTAGAMA